jgi:site-specific recombinase XerD
LRRRDFAVGEPGKTKRAEHGRDQRRAVDGDRLSRLSRSTVKKDRDAPRGVFRHPGGGWAIRFTCGAGHVHEQRIGPLKGDAVRAHASRRQRAHSEPAWCPVRERIAARKQAKAAAQLEQQRVAFETYSEQYLTWAEAHQRSFKTTRAEVGWLVRALGDRQLDQVKPADVEAILAGLQTGKSPSGRALSGAATNRYRDRLSGMFKRAVRLGLVERNPVTGIPKHKEPGGRIIYMTDAEEAAILEALPEPLRPMFTVSINTGLRWSEQRWLTWADVDLLSGTLTVKISKHGRMRQVPTNSTVRNVLVDLEMRRGRPEDPKELVFACPYREAAKFFPQTVTKAQAILRNLDQDASRLEGFTWHGLRHTFASRLVMAGVDLRTVQELGGWRTLAMVQRYSHLGSDHLQAAVDRLVRRAGRAEPGTV